MDDSDQAALETPLEAPLEPPAASPLPPYDGPTLRTYIREGKRSLIVKGLPRRGWNDAYHIVLTMPLWGLVLLLLAAFLTLNATFAGLYMLDPGGVAGARPGSFSDLFFFSAQTLGTVGYGLMTPHSLYANVLSTAEMFLNLIFVALSTGLVFTRVSRPTARVMFSDNAVVNTFQGVPTLMFRAANQRGNQILEAEVSVSLARQLLTAEGHVMRQFQELTVTRSRSPLFALSWQVMHPIDASSPLFGETQASLVAAGVEIVIALSGLDETFGQRIHTRHSYLPQEILWGKRFVDVLSAAPDGRRVVDYRRFHDLHDA